MDFDDGQHLYGKGMFIESKRKIILESFKIVRTLFNYSNGQMIKDNSISDTASIESLTFYKKGNYLILYEKKKNWWKKRNKTLYMNKDIKL